MTIDFRPIDDFFADQQRISESLIEKRDISLNNEFTNMFSKSLTIVVASYFESIMKNIVYEGVKKSANRDMICQFAYIKGINRQYHTWFDWAGGSVNPFFALFGSEFLELCKLRLKDEALKSSAKSFLYIGRLRNEIIHENFLQFSIPDTPNDIYLKANNSKLFIEFCETQFI